MAAHGAEQRQVAAGLPGLSTGVAALTRRGSLKLAAATWLAAAAAPGRAQDRSDIAPAALALPITERRLANGLHVVALPMPQAASVAVQVWYRVGAKDDPPGRSGFAHLFEHMMFKSTRRMRAEMFDRLTEDVGGQNNAFTSEDVTAYQSEVPANHLQRLLWAEAERMSNLNVDQLNFDSERKVVQEEYRQGVLANPYGRLWHALPTLHYTRHPYRRPTIGSIEDLARARLDDVRRFHDTYYRPDNAVLLVCGGFDMAELQAGVDRTFGSLPAPRGSVPRVNVQEPRRTADRRVTLRAPGVPLPALALLWKGPAVSDADTPALRIASALLSAGESARLNEALVYRDRSAQQAGFEAWLSADAGMLIGYGIAAAGAPLARIERGLLAEIQRLASQPIAPEEMDKVRAQLLTAALVKRQSPAGLANSLGEAVLLHGDARRAERELPELQAVTPADVQRVLRRHVLNGRRVTVHYLAQRG